MDVSSDELFIEYQNMHQHELKEQQAEHKAVRTAQGLNKTSEKCEVVFSPIVVL